MKGFMLRPALAASVRIGFVGSSNEMRTPICAFSRSTTPRRSRTWDAVTPPAFTERMTCFVLPEVPSSWKKSRPSIPLSAPFFS